MDDAAGAPMDPTYPPPKSGEPPLHRAARRGDVETIRSLVVDGADINATFDVALAPESQEWLATPLMVAAGSGDGADVATIRTLLELGADPRVVLDLGSAATLACRGLGWTYNTGGDADRLRLLLDAGSPLPEDPADLNTLLCDVAAKGDPARLAVLLDLGIDPRGHFDPVTARAEHEAWTAFAADHSGIDVSDVPETVRQSMLEAKLKWRDEFIERAASAPADFEIPLFRAAQSGSAECVGLLLARGADPLTRDSSSRTAMYYASSEQVARALLSAGLSIEDADKYGWSPLANAVADGSESLDQLRSLIAAGANVNATHDRGYTVFMSAVSSMARHVDVLRALIGAGADPHAVSELGYNAFHAAVDVAGDEQTVREVLGFLSELGVDINRRNSSGLTPLARAIQDGTALDVRVLCELGADVNTACTLRRCRAEECQDHDAPPLFHAIVGHGVDRNEKIETLLRAGADILAVDHDACSPLGRAVSLLCSEASDYKKAFASFYRGLSELTHPGSELPRERDAFINAITPIVREYVRMFEAAIPLRPSHELVRYAQEARDQLVAGIVLLCAYEAWARVGKMAGMG